MSSLFSVVFDKVPLGKLYDFIVDAVLRSPALQARRANAKARRAYELGNLSQAATLYRLAGSLGKADSLERSHTITALAEVYLQMGDYPEAGRWCEQASRLNEDRADAKGQAQCARIRGDVQLWQGDHYGADQNYIHALAVCPADDVQGKARILRSQGQSLLRRNNRAGALSLAHSAELLCGQAGDLVGKIYALRDQAKVFLLEGSHTSADKPLQQALKLSKNNTNAVVQADLLRSLAELRRQQGLLAEAICCCEAAVEVYDRYGHAIGVTDSWLLQGQILGEQEQWSDAAHKLRMVVPRYADAGDRTYEAYARTLLGEALGTLGKSVEALAEWGKAAKVYSAAADLRGLANVQARVVDLGLKLHRWTEAETGGHELERKFAELADEPGQARTLRCIADALAGQGRDQQANGTYQRALEIFRRYQDVAGELEVLRRLRDTLERLGEPGEAQRMQQLADELSTQNDDARLLNQIDKLRSSLE